MNNTAKPSSNTDYFAALDIGSNSFHYVLARQVGDHLQILHGEKYQVQLAQGLDSNNLLSASALSRGVSTLAHLATTTTHIQASNFRAVATFTLRQAKNSAAFLKAARKVFPFNIEVISGHEEARLIYQGVAHYLQNDIQQLVLDIGGGSTECVIGKKDKIQTLDSLNMGCVSYQKQFFPNHIICKKAFKQAILSAKHEVDAIVKRFKKQQWQHVVGTSGTIKAISRIVNYHHEIQRPFTLQDLLTIKQQLLTFNHSDDIVIDGLKENRKAVICSGVAILIALMERLEISEIEYCQYALREGVLFEQLENLKHNNVRLRTISNLIERFNIDKLHASHVNSIAMKMFNQVSQVWQLTDAIYHELLQSAIQLHEIGMDINASGYHKHGQYILEQADLAGFNQEQQKALAWLVGNQRKKITQAESDIWYLLSEDKLLKLCMIVRISVLLTQQRHHDDQFLSQVIADKKSLTLTLDKQWLQERPIIDTELFYEQQNCKKCGYQLLINQR
ncbi:exopolyphosphatase [Thalassotalea insulae]|uniref:Exopolyphosphatase n=1 Tax=Thalassotalea insulae TaxID=2056778 RepID=A0ABQ6GTR9_9GAMM|nr:Ppx/GppA phosphatase family protein [Thalassotalea insulae]GLX79338.1 exopolyphosphatase [Thalassotalea insulae]